VTSFKALKEAPDAAKYPYASRWYKHIASYESEFASLPGDPSKSYTSYGPDSSELPINPAKAPAVDKGDDDDDDDDANLFGSDEEEEDPEEVKAREARLAEYRKKKESKPKPAAKSIVTLDVKPWGMSYHN
jgi:elongation factor 1-beta